MPEAVDPFEAFRKKKDADKKAAAIPEIKPVLPPAALAGRPRGFASHRFDFAKPDAARSGGKTKIVELPKPKGFKPTNVADGPKEGVTGAAKPRGFNRGKLVDKPRKA